MTARKKKTPTHRSPARKSSGRRPLLTRAVHETIIGALRLGLSEAKAAALVGLAPSTISTWKAKGEDAPDGPYREFLNDVMASEPRFEMSNLAVVQKAARMDWKAAAWLLERKCHTDWGRKDRLNLGDADTPSAVFEVRLPVVRDEA